MKRFVDIVIFILLSPEILVIVVLFGISKFFPDLFIVLGETLKSDNDIAKVIFVIPLGLLGFAGRYAWKLLFPGDDNSFLHEWEHYPKLKDRVIVSLGYCVLGTIASFLGWIIIKDITAYQLGGIVLISIAVSFTVISIMYLNAFKIREIVGK